MKFEEYVELAMRTKPMEMTPTESLLNACLGLVGEYAEYERAETKENKIEELGDIHWYVALLQKTLVKHYEGRTPSIENMLTVIGNICDDVKKHVYQGHTLDVEETRKDVVRLIIALRQECKIQGTTQAKVMSDNVAKLKARYPEGFEVEKSVNRIG